MFHHTKEFVSHPTRIRGIGTAISEIEISNTQLSNWMDTSDQWIRSRTGIQSRRIAGLFESVTSLTTKASRHALHCANMHPEEIDLIICATSIPDNLYPSTACEIQHLLKCHNAVAFNLVAACSGFVFALKVAENFIRSGTYANILITGCDLHSRFLDWKDRNSSILFGDGAGAFLLSRGKKDEINHVEYTRLYSDGSQGKHLVLPLVPGGTAPMPEFKKLKENRPFVQMNGKEIYRFSTRIIPKSIIETLKDRNLNLDDIDYIIPHQANIRIIEAIRTQLNLQNKQIIIAMEQTGNTSSASLPLAFHHAVKNKQIQFPARIVMVGFGSGLTWGISLLNIEAEPCKIV